MESGHLTNSDNFNKVGDNGQQGLINYLSVFGTWINRSLFIFTDVKSGNEMFANKAVKYHVIRFWPTLKDPPPCDIREVFK